MKENMKDNYKIEVLSNSNFIQFIMCKMYINMCKNIRENIRKRERKKEP